METARPFVISLVLVFTMSSPLVFSAERSDGVATAPAAAAEVKAQGTHTVVEGETLDDIAASYHVAVRQLQYFNSVVDPELIEAGQDLVIPPSNLRVPWEWHRAYATGRLGERLQLPSGAESKQPVVVVRRPHAIAVTADTPIGVYEVARGDSLSLIATEFGVKVGHLLAINTLDNPDLLEIGDRLLVPDPNGLLPPVTPPSEYTFMWPLDEYKVVSEFGGRGDREHEGIDMAATAHSPIRAAADGTVIFAGEQRGYGLVVVLDHGNGVETLYAHNTRNRVTRGQTVLQGQAIATVGMTGNARGNHLHFEYTVDGEGKEPRDYIETVLRDEG